MKIWTFLVGCILVMGIQSCKSKDVRGQASQSEAGLPTITLSAATVKRTYPGIAGANITDQYTVLWSVDEPTTIIVDSIVMADTTVATNLVTIQGKAFKKGAFIVEQGELVRTLFERIIDRSNDSKKFDSSTARCYYTIAGKGQVSVEIPGFIREKDVLAP